MYIKGANFRNFQILRICYARAERKKGAKMPASKTFWNKIARKYAADPIADPAGYQRTLDHVRALLPADARVLELGCGTGSTALLLAEGTGPYLATDFSTEMIAIAQEKLAATPRPNLRLEVASATELADRGQVHDAVLGFNYLHLVDDLPATLAAIHALLPPSGLFVSKTACLAQMNPLIRLAVPVMQWIGKAPHVNILSDTSLQQAIRAAGFHVEGCEYHGSGRKDARAVIVARKPG